MNSATGIIALLLLVAVSLTVVSLVNRVQTRNRLIRLKIHQLRRRLNELEELCTAVEPLLESILIPRLINEEILDLIHSIERLEDHAPYLDASRENAQQLAKQLEEERRSQSLHRLMSSDAAIAKNQYYLTDAARLVRRHHALGRLEASEMESYIAELSWAHLMVEVISHIGHGHKAVSRGDHLVAYGYYRKAQNLLINHNHRDDRRHRFIRELGEILSNRRTAISTDLMPETDYNPTANAKNLPDEVTVALSALNPSNPDEQHKAS